MNTWSQVTIASGAVFLTSSVMAEVIIPLKQSRVVSATTTAVCEGTIDSSVGADNLLPFEDAVASLQICDEVGTVATADAEQSSAIGTTIVSALGAANAGGEGPGGIHAFSSSLFEVFFAVEIPCRYRISGELQTRFGLPGGHESSVALEGAGVPVFSEAVIGDGGPMQALPFESSGVLIDGPYTLSAGAFVSPADLMEQIPSPSANYNLMFEVFKVADLNLSGAVNIDDIFEVIGAFGDCEDVLDCPADISPLGGNGMVDIDDLMAVINAVE